MHTRSTTPICPVGLLPTTTSAATTFRCFGPGPAAPRPDRKSTRLNSSHLGISYAVFCLKKKQTTESTALPPTPPPTPARSPTTTPTPHPSTLSPRDALPICRVHRSDHRFFFLKQGRPQQAHPLPRQGLTTD